MKPVSDVFLLSVAEIAATLIGLLLVGAFFYVETGLRRLGRAREAATSYLRAGTRIVLVLYGMTLALSLSLVALESIWTSVFFAVLSLLLLAANVATSLRIRALAKLTRSRAVLVNDLVSSAGILALVAIPWVLGGLHPTREDLTWAILLSLATGFICTGTLVLSVFDLSKMEAAARAETGWCHGRSSETYRRIATRPPVRGDPQGPVPVHRTHSPAATFEYTIFKIPLDWRQVPDDRFSPFQIVPIRGIMLRRTNDGGADMAPGSRSVPDVGEDRIGQLLAAKFATPLLHSGIVSRERLSQRLDGNGTQKLSVVVAPAGWGKTTLLAEWARRTRDRQPVAWLTLDETDDEPQRFWTYVVTALMTAKPGLGDAALVALRVPGLDPIDVALPALLNDLSGTDAKQTLILDDYHMLTDARIHEEVEYLLSYLPPSLRLVIAGRLDPPLPLARMRARSELTEIRAADLRFSPAEAAGLVSAVGQVDAGSDVVDPLVNRTEGWAVGLKLAALTIRGAPDPAARAAEVRGDDRHIIDFLTSEVLDRLPTDRRDFLVRTAVLDRLCGSLCDAVLERAASSAVLDALERADLFVVPLDVHREWYRYHRLFRDVLRRELEATAPADVPKLLRRAADWYLAAGQTEDAVRLWIGAGDRLQAAQVLLAAEDDFLEQGLAATFLRLGDDLGEAIIRADPRLAVSMAGAAGQSGQPDRVPALLDITEANLGDDRPVEGWRSLAAAAAVLRAAYDPVVRADPPVMLGCAERAASLETDPTLQGYVVARITLGAVLSGLDRRAEAVPVLKEAWERSAHIPMPMFIRLQAAGLLAMCLLETGQEDAARRLVRQTAPAVQATVDALGDASAVAVTFLITIEGRLAYQDGETESAWRLLARAAELARIAGHPSQQVYVLIALADAALATGDRAAARAALDEARETADTGVAFPATARRLAAAEERIGKRAGRAAWRNGQLAEELTDRELSLLRALQGPLSQREIGAELYLSLNTIKGYTKSLYRKLGAASRAEAVKRGRQFGLI